MENLPILPTIARSTVPLLIFRIPLLGILLSNLCDLYDWKFIDHSTPSKLAFYQNWDKSFDLYYLTFIFIIAFGFKDKLAKNTAIFLFLYRLIGLAFFYTTHNRQFLFFFPNIFENFVIFYLTYKLFSKKDVLFDTHNKLILVLSVIAIPKLIHEFFQHFLLHHPWEYFDVAGWLGTTGVVQEYLNYGIFGSLLYFIPMGGALIYLLKRKKSKK